MCSQPIVVYLISNWVLFTGGRRTNNMDFQQVWTSFQLEFSFAIFIDWNKLSDFLGVFLCFSRCVFVFFTQFYWLSHTIVLWAIRSKHFSFHWIVDWNISGIFSVVNKDVSYTVLLVSFYFRNDPVNVLGEPFEPLLDIVKFVYLKHFSKWSKFVDVAYAIFAIYLWMSGLSTFLTNIWPPHHQTICVTNVKPHCIIWVIA